MQIFVVLLLASVVAGEDLACDPLEQLPCDNGYCISKLQWCDAVRDCPDGSDEMYCNGEIECQPSHFKCDNGKCIPNSATCDKFDDCHDGSDEQDCGDDDLQWLKDSSQFSTRNYHEIQNASRDAVIEAVNYFLALRDTDNGWGTFTPRAIVALSIAGKELLVPDEDKELMQKQLNVQLLLDSVENQTPMSLSSLALYVNALHASCQDPRSFQGMDLVSRLRSETDIAVKSNRSIPLAFLSLCISNKTTYEDNFQLANMYNSREFSRTGSRALIMMAMACVMHKDGNNIFEKYIYDFIVNESGKAENADIYTQALFLQASNALEVVFPMEKLLTQQLTDGSFGDMLATYYAIPALMGSSLLNLPCGSRSKGSVSERQIAKADGENEVAFSLWIPSMQGVSSHSLSVKFDGRKSFFDIMNVAAARNPLYRFFYDESRDGKMVYSIAGIPDDIESGTLWVLYSGGINNVTVNSMNNLKQEFDGVDNIFPEDGEHFIFWLKRDHVV